MRAIEWRADIWVQLPGTARERHVESAALLVWVGHLRVHLWPRSMAEMMRSWKPTRERIHV
jgi:hypothetical protein